MVEREGARFAGNDVNGLGGRLRSATDVDENRTGPPAHLGGILEF